jgi:predicted nucleic acid-binding protein
MTGLVFVDTNVLLYAIDTHDAHKHRQARDWINRLWRERNGRTSVQVLSEYYVHATRVSSVPLSREKAWEQVVAFYEWQPRAVDIELLESARRIQDRYRLNWWDSLVVAAAHALGCAMLLSEDMQHGAVYSGVTCMNPFRTGVQESSEVNSPLAQPILRRGRGRPKRAVVQA